MTNAATSLPKPDGVMRLIPGGVASLAQLSDDELLASTRRLVGKSNQLLAALLVHLAEVEVRGVHRARSCASLYTYCIYELRFSEDAAARRSAAARFVKQFPALLDLVADGELHLTGLLMIAPHLTPENQAEVLGRARFRTKKELAKLVRELSPLPGVPDVVEPLGSEPVQGCRNPTWPQFVRSFCPPVRDLPAGERPRDWANDGLDEEPAAKAGVGWGLDAGTERGFGLAAKAGVDRGPAAGADGGFGLIAETERGLALDAEAEVGFGLAAKAGVERGLAAETEARVEEELLPVGPVPADLPPLSSPQRYGLQFETGEEHVQLIERAKALMARERPGVSLGELHLEAMKLLVASLEKRKFAARITPRPHPQHASAARQVGSDPSQVALQHQTELRPIPPESRRDELRQDESRSASESHQDESRQDESRQDESRQHEPRAATESRRSEPRWAELRSASESRRSESRSASESRRSESRSASESHQAEPRQPELRPGASESHRAEPRTGASAPHASSSEPRRRGDSPDAADGCASGQARSRHIPAALRREVYERDAGRCGFVDGRGQRCCETRYLELHHLEPFARGGAHSASNLALRCSAHNRLAAEQDFGEGLIASHREAARHESLSRQRVDDVGLD
jgi:5-methylcytosine-specific restriction endonuclease McrA